MKKRLLWLIFLFPLFSRAQVSNTGFIDTGGGEHIGKITIGAYMDLYYGHYTRRTGGTGSVPFMVSSNRNNELNLNLAHLDVRYRTENLRARFVPGFGTYMNSNHGPEPQTLAFVVEASAGIRLSKKKDIWLDGGVIGSPYTNENPVSKEHLMYTRSLAAENVPYYQTGLRLAVPVGKKMHAYLYGLNGWQQLQDQNQFKSFGTQLEWNINDNNLLNWDTYMGDERSAARPLDRMRWLTDLYWIGKAGNWDFTSSVYAGLQQRRTPAPDSTQPNPGTTLFTQHLWYSANFITRWHISPKWAVSARAEYFHDPDHVMQTPAGVPATGYKTGSGSACISFQPADHVLYRMEYRHFYSPDLLYLTSNGASHTADWFTCSVAVWF
ncbi:MAG: outer membrane beta-barrel protein [Bacteroidetes bacterium]|nr:outer membrane beta-barrel protein [Bacteroidota bacterium]